MANTVKKVIVDFEANTSGLDQVNKKLDQTTENVKEVDKATGDAAKSMDKLAKSTEGVAKAEPAFKSLKQQIREARNDATTLAQRFGETSKEALAAAQRVATLTEELDDFNQRVKALNPEAKFNSVSNAIQGTLGGLQGLTGALQLFGSESEEVEKIAQKLQGALNLAQGVNSVLGLKDAFANLRVVLGLTSAAQTALGTATTATAVATEGATVAAAGFSAVLTATGIGAIVVALGGLIAAYVALQRQIDQDTRALERFERKQQDILAARDLFDKTFNKVLSDRLDLLDFEIEKAQARKASEEEILRLQIRRVEAERAALLAATRTGTALPEAQEKYNERLKETRQQLELLQIRLEALPITVERAATEIKPLDVLPSPSSIEEQATEALDVVGKVIDEKSTDLKLPPFFTEEELKRQEEIVRGSLSVITGLFTDIFADQSRAAYEEDSANLEEARKKNLITEEQYQAGLRKLKRRQAEEEKKQAIFRATLDFSNALINALTFTPATGIPAALILANIVAAANLARIIAAPIPKFKKGALNIGSGNADGDGGSLAIVHPGEAVIPADRNKAYHPAIKAIFNRKISPKDINAFVTQKLQGRIGSSVKAEVDTYGLARVMRKNNGVNVTNGDTLARSIAREISNTYNRRRE